MINSNPKPADLVNFDNCSVDISRLIMAKIKKKSFEEEIASLS